MDLGFLPSASVAFSSLAAAVVLILLVPIMLQPTQSLHWLQRKHYQYEVTFSLYMLTPTEKFIFNSLLFLILSMILIAASLYLPEHVSEITRRAFYYYAGEYPPQNTAGPLPKGVSESLGTI
ncbi:hypothetical protein EV356DRAFT_508505 [Viridothelium virens]|uniref:Uncharacterized protein n=1 Tax=Viridothelium virens TaxID=1048519 RepID=A0A6A6GYN2_VIRVR|nr:hypothetical protein EV356DRAFT_508505 [Viridothelium virens]